MELTYSDVLEYCMEEGIQLSDEEMQAVQESLASKAAKELTKIDVKTAPKRAKVQGDIAHAKKVAGYNANKAKKALTNNRAVGTARVTGKAAKEIAGGFGKSFADATKDSFRKHWMESGIDYATALEFFAENGIQLDAEQIANLQEASKASVKTAATSAKIQGGIAHAGKVGGAAARTAGNKAGNFVGKFAPVAGAAAAGAGAAALIAHAKKRKEEKEAEKSAAQQ